MLNTTRMYLLKSFHLMKLILMLKEKLLAVRMTIEMVQGKGNAQKILNVVLTFLVDFA
jgi:hypothetical protein